MTRVAVVEDSPGPAARTDWDTVSTETPWSLTRAAMRFANPVAASSSHTTPVSIDAQYTVCAVSISSLACVAMTAPVAFIGCTGNGVR